MLEFTRSIGLGVNIGDLFELKRTFQGDGVMHPAAQEQGMMFVSKLFGPGFDLRFNGQYGGNSGREVTQILHQARQMFCADGAFDFSQYQGEHIEGCQLCGEGFG